MNVVQSGSGSCLLLAAVDRTTSEDIPFVIERLMAAGARNVNIIPAIGKKGRTSFLTFIDIPDEHYQDVVEVMVCHLYCTGWHRLSSRHEFVRTRSRSVALAYRVDDLVIDLTLPVKVLDGADGRAVILLEHDVCADLHRRHLQGHSTRSLFDLKVELLHLAKSALTAEESDGQPD